jgi:hypothetical protein
MIREIRATQGPAIDGEAAYTWRRIAEEEAVAFVMAYPKCSAAVEIHRGP